MLGIAETLNYIPLANVNSLQIIIIIKFNVIFYYFYFNF